MGETPTLLSTNRSNEIVTAILKSKLFQEKSKPLQNVFFWDDYEQRITFDDDTLVKANEIIDIKGELFDNRAF